MRKAVIIPRSVVAKLGKGDHASGAQLLDSFIGSDPEPIDWHEGEEGDYIVRQEDVERCGKGCHKRGMRLLTRLFRDHT
jgi:methylmalonyl-CoA mutase cobalamin-binding subunit